MAVAETQAATFPQLPPIVFLFSRSTRERVSGNQSDGMQDELGEASLMRYAIPAILHKRADNFGATPDFAIPELSTCLNR